MLNDPTIEAVSIEDRDGGAFDDIVIRRTAGDNVYEQIKTSVHGDVLVTTDWLTTKLKDGGRSPLQRYFETWKALTAEGHPFELRFVSNRGFDAADPLLGKLRDLTSERINAAAVASAGPSSKVGRTRKVWVTNLGVDVAELLAFLAKVTWKSAPSESDIDKYAQKEMRLAGLRADTDALTIGKALVRSWVTNGIGPQTRADLQRQVAAKDLLARTGTLVLAVHAVDRQPLPVTPNVEVDFVDLYDGDDSFSRVQLRNPDHWSSVVQPRLVSAAREMEAYATRRVHVVGSMRLPVWFAVGRALPDVRGWVLSVEQRGEEWRTDAVADLGVQPIVIAEADLGAGAELAVVLAITNDPSSEVTEYLATEEVPVGPVLVLGPEGGVGKDAALGAGWTAAWTRAARERARESVAKTGTRRVHLFMAAPAAAALMAGHQWNLLPPTVVYEHLRPGYARTIEFN